MRRRRWVSLIALAAVLLHCAAVVYHHQAMLAAHAAHQQLLSALTVLCSGGKSHEVEDASLPAPAEHSTGCLVCKGLIPPFALPASFAIAEPHLYVGPVERPVPCQTGQDQRIAGLPPPARGPPA